MVIGILLYMYRSWDHPSPSDLLESLNQGYQVHVGPEAAQDEV